MFEVILDSAVMPVWYCMAWFLLILKVTRYKFAPPTSLFSFILNFSLTTQVCLPDFSTFLFFFPPFLILNYFHMGHFHFQPCPTFLFSNLSSLLYSEAILRSKSLLTLTLTLNYSQVNRGYPCKRCSSLNLLEWGHIPFLQQVKNIFLQRTP